MEKTPKKEHKRFYEPVCSPEVDVTEWQVNQRGHHVLKVIGKKNLNDEIQLYKDQTDIKILVSRLKAGDPELMIKLSEPGFYGDVNNYPEECHPAAMDDSLKQFYENQPVSVKEKYPRYEDFKNYFLNLTNDQLGKMQEAEDAAAKKAAEEKAAKEAALAQAAIDAQAAAIAKAIKESK